MEGRLVRHPRCEGCLKRRGLRPPFFSGAKESDALDDDFFLLGCDMRCGGNKGAVFLVLIFLSFQFCFTSASYAGAAPAYNGRMNSAVSNLIQKKLVSRGFAANDPRYTATVAAVGSGLTLAATQVAATTAVAGIAAVSWPAVLVGAGVTALVGGIIGFIADGGIDWLWGADFKAQLSGDGMATITGGSTLYPSEPADYSALGTGTHYYMSNGVVNLAVVLNVPCGDPCASWSLPAGYSNFMNGSLSGPYTGQFDGSQPYYTLETWSFSGSYSLVYKYRPATGEVVSVSPQTTPYQPTMKHVDALPADIPDAAMDDPVSNVMLADAANAAWANAEEAPLPWSASDPITPADVADWAAANPSQVPTVADFFAPVAGASDSSVSLPLPSGSPNPSTSTPGTGQSVDLGVDPNTPPPTLEQAPTAQMILAPILNLLPDFRSFSVPAHASQCPQPSFTALDRTYVIDSHCALIDQHKGVIEVAMLLVWTLTALFITLRA